MAAPPTRPRQPSAPLPLKRRPADRPRRVPHAAAPDIGEWEEPSVLFDRAGVEAVAAAAKLALSPEAAGALAAELSEAGNRLLRHLEAPEPSPPGERARWADGLAQAARALIEEFDLDPDAAGFRPSDEAMTILLGRDRARLSFGVAGPDDPEMKALIEMRAAADRLLADLLAHTFPNPFLGPKPSQWELEYLSFMRAGPKSTIAPEAEGVALTLLGLAHLAKSAAVAAGGYKRSQREENRLPPDRVFFVGLCRAYVNASGSNRGISRDAHTREPGGPRVEFCQAVARHLADIAEGRLAEDPGRCGKAVRDLRKWASRPGAVAEQVRDA